MGGDRSAVGSSRYFQLSYEGRGRSLNPERPEASGLSPCFHMQLRNLPLICCQAASERIAFARAKTPCGGRGAWGGAGVFDPPESGTARKVSGVSCGAPRVFPGASETLKTRTIETTTWFIGQRRLDIIDPCALATRNTNDGNRYSST